MLDIVFNDSACGSLKFAQNFDTEGSGANFICVIGRHEDGSKLTEQEIETIRRQYEENERQKWENAVLLGGNASDIYSFHLALNMGDIAEEDFWQNRLKMLERLWSVYPEGTAAARDVMARAQSGMEEVLARAKEGESMRLWYSNDPNEYCGLYWFMRHISKLGKKCGRISIVKLPEWEMDKNGNIKQKQSWGEVSAEEWQGYLQYQRTVSHLFCEICAARWQTLREENATLRAVLNGRLVSVSDSVYDCFIEREIAEEDGDFEAGRVIGRVLGKQRLGISDTWVALRIEEMIRMGRLEVVEEARDEELPSYYRILRKCGK